MNYTSSVVGFLPEQWGGFLAIVAAVLEIILSVLLILGYQLKYVSIASGMLLLGFALAMAFSFGIKTPLDYLVFCGGCGFVLIG